MNEQHRRQISIRGAKVWVPAITVPGRTIIVTGRMLRMATVEDEAFVVASHDIDPDQVRAELRRASLRADILTFSQHAEDRQPRHRYHHEWDSAAVAPCADYDAWWEALPQEFRKNVRRAAKRGVVTRAVEFDDALVQGIKALYDETPVRQGRRFWHYGKSMETVRAENATYLQRARFVGAYHEGELIGFVKFVYCGKLAIIMQILASSAHYDKRPMNALVAKAMEICHQDGMAGLVYSKFNYGNKKNDTMSEFKRRSGFVEVLYPKYFVPLSLRGKVAIALRLHRGALGLLPPRAIEALLALRGRFLRWSTGSDAKNITAPAVDVAERAG